MSRHNLLFQLALLLIITQVLCDISHPEVRMPIVGLAFSKDNQRLFASAENGKVMCWERPGYQGREINFMPFLG